MRPMVVMLGFLMLPVSVYATDQFVYDAHSKRDPFSSLVTSSGAMVAYDSELTLSDLNLEGVLADPQGNSAAIINGKIVKVKDQIGSYQVETIAADHVDLIKDNEQFTIKLKKGGS